MKKFLLFIMLTISLSLIAKENSFDKTVNKTEQGINTIYNDSKELTKTVYSDLKSITPKLESAINSVASGLKVGAENVWQILIKQQLVWSIAFLLLTLSSIINWFFFYKKSYINIKNVEWTILERDMIGDIPNEKFDNYYYQRSLENPEMYKNDIRKDKYVKGIVGKEQYNAPKIIDLIEINNKWFKYLHFTICLILSILSIYHFSDMLTGFINPEFGAMKMLFETVKTLK